MALFGKLFEKKICSICGGEIGLLGNRKLEDGNCCKTCTKKLSPWFEERRHSTVAQIQEQLVYRAKNAQDLASFQVSRVIGESYKVYIEDIGGVPTRFFVTDAADYMEKNPDIIRFADVLSCVTDIRTTRTEIKQKDADGNMISYSPPRYKVHHNFYIQMHVDGNPYFSDIEFWINSGVVTLEMTASTGILSGIFGSTRSGFGLRDLREEQRYQEYSQMCQEIEQAVRDGRTAAMARAGARQSAAAPVQAPVPAPAPVFAAAPAPEPVPAPAPAESWQCPSCGSANTSKFCANCGAMRPAAPTGCASCGWQLPQGVNAPKFCPECGTPFAR